MASRQDQLHSYQFTVQRVVAAVVQHETDPVRSPFRRVAAATLVGALLAALGLAGAAVFGVLAGGGDSGWRDPGAVLVERESGARYVYRDGRLHPVLNYASALLVVGSTPGHTVLVSRSALSGVPRGVPLGIPGAPDSLPAPGRLSAEPWTVCSRSDASPQSALLVGSRAAGGRTLDDRALLVSTVDGERYVVWHLHRYRVRDPRLVLAAFGWDSAIPVPVAPAVVNALPAGPDLARVPVANRGRPSPAVRDARIGQVYVVETQGGGRQYAVALADGLAPVTQVQADLLLVDPDTVAAIGQHEATKLGQGDFAAARPAVLPAPGDLPATTPSLVSSATTVCAVVPDARGPSEVRVDAQVPDGGFTTPSRVDRVVVPAGRATLVEALASPVAPNGTLSLVTDLGVRYPVASPEVPAMLGYAGVTPVRLPSALVALLPEGPALDPAAARNPAP